MLTIAADPKHLAPGSASPSDSLFTPGQDDDQWRLRGANHPRRAARSAGAVVDTGQALKSCKRENGFVAPSARI